MELRPQDRELVETALQVRNKAYAPYSGYPVGAALRTRTGKVFTGVNVENAAFPSSMCAERAAVFSAVTSGEQEFDTIAVVTRNGGTPCGACRQVLSEFGTDISVLIVDQDRKVHRVITLGELLPGGFSGKDLD